MTKRIDADWAAGTGNGGKLSAAALTNTTYHIHAIKKDSDGSVDYGFDVSPTAPTMPAGYTYFRRIGSVIRASNALVGFVQNGDVFRRKVIAKDLEASQASTNAISRTLSVPIGIVVEAFGSFNLIGDGANTSIYLFTALDETDTSAAIRSRATSTTSQSRILTEGWIDTRGRLA